MNGHHFGIMITGVEIRVNKYLAEAPRKALMLLGINLLIAKKYDAMIQQRLAYVGYYRITQIHPEIDAQNLRTNGRR